MEQQLKKRGLNKLYYMTKAAESKNIAHAILIVHFVRHLDRLCN